MNGSNRLFFEGEEQKYKTGKHWVVFFKTIIYFYLALYVWRSQPYLAGLLKFNVPEDFKRVVTATVDGFIICIRYGFTGLFLLCGLSGLLSFFALRLFITSKRLVKFDFILGSLYSIDLNKIESVKADPGIFGGVLGYGKVTVTTGSGQQLVISNLKRPHEFEKELFCVK